MSTTCTLTPLYLITIKIILGVKRTDQDFLPIVFVFVMQCEESDSFTVKL